MQSLEDLLKLTGGGEGSSGESTKNGNAHNSKEMQSIEDVIRSASMNVNQDNGGGSPASNQSYDEEDPLSTLDRSALMRMLPFHNDKRMHPYKIGNKQSGRPKKLQPNSSYLLYPRNNIICFLNEVEKYPILYDTTHPEFANTKMKDRVYDLVEKNCSSFLARGRYNHGSTAKFLYDDISGEFRREQVRMESTGSQQLPSQFLYWDECQFLNGRRSANGHTPTLGDMLMMKMEAEDEAPGVASSGAIGIGGGGGGGRGGIEEVGEITHFDIYHVITQHLNRLSPAEMVIDKYKICQFVMGLTNERFPPVK